MFSRQIERSSTVHIALLTEGESIVALFYKHSPANGGRAGKTLRPAKDGGGRLTLDDPSAREGFDWDLPGEFKAVVHFAAH